MVSGEYRVAAYLVAVSRDRHRRKSKKKKVTVAFSQSIITVCLARHEKTRLVKKEGKRQNSLG